MEVCKFFTRRCQEESALDMSVLRRSFLPRCVRRGALEALDCSASLILLQRISVAEPPSYRSGTAVW